MTFYQIPGIYTLQDIKYDLLKIIEPHDGWMFNEKDSDRVKALFESFLGDLQGSRKIFNFTIQVTEKENAYTYDVQIKINKDRSPKKLKIHVGKFVYTDPMAIDLTVEIEHPDGTKSSHKADIVPAEKEDANKGKEVTP
tara:strand:+ start:23195 stop:23611 length:417 start_codon:yes stop_codon:yes gene_type:complete